MIKKITWEEMQEMRGNTKFWTELFPKMDTDAFIKQANHYLANCSHTRHKNTTYDDAIMNTVLPEALKRIQELEANLNEEKAKIWEEAALKCQCLDEGYYLEQDFLNKAKEERNKNGK